MLFLDWEKAFDKIAHARLHSALEHMGLDPMYARVIDALKANLQFTISSAGGSSKAHTASLVIRQGCPLSLYLFLFVQCVHERGRFEGRAGGGG